MAQAWALRQRQTVDHERRLGVRQHRCDPLHRVGRIDGQVTRATLQDSQQRDQYLRRPRQGQCDKILRAHAAPDQGAGKPVGLQLQFGIGHPFIALLHGDGVGRARGLLAEQHRDVFAGDVMCRVVRRRQRLEFSRLQQLKTTDRQVTVISQAFEAAGQSCHQPLRCIGAD